jgi:hypothetical protein
MRKVSDGSRDCSKGFEYKKALYRSLNVGPGEKTDCWCKGFYEGYDQ